MLRRFNKVGYNIYTKKFSIYKLIGIGIFSWLFFLSLQNRSQ